MKLRKITNFSRRAHKWNKARTRQARNGRAFDHGRQGGTLGRADLERIFGGAPTSARHRRDES
jgi:hypothetical protein